MAEVGAGDDHDPDADASQAFHQPGQLGRIRLAVLDGRAIPVEYQRTEWPGEGVRYQLACTDGKT